MTQAKATTILSFKGKLSFETIEQLLNKFKEGIKPYHIDLVIEKRIYRILVECLENTYRHKINVNTSPKYHSIEFLLNDFNSSFQIEVGNYITKTNVKAIIDRIGEVNALDKEGLNKLYRESISKARISDKGGAGLGIIEIARNSRQKIKYKLSEEEGNTTFFTFVVTVNKS